MKSFTVIVTGKTPGNTYVTHTLTVESTDALGAVNTAYRELESDPVMCETEWAALALSVVQSASVPTLSDDLSALAEAQSILADSGQEEF